MALRFVSVLAALVLVAACASKPDQTGAAEGEGGATNVSRSTSPTAEAMPGPRPGSPEDFIANVGDRVFFGFDQYTLTGEARDTLQLQAEWLKQHPAVTVTLEGHADERGTREYNLALGERRSNSAKNYLVALGVDPNRVQVISYGKERPAVVGSNESAWSQNRRAVTVIRAPGV